MKTFKANILFLFLPFFSIAMAEEQYHSICPKVTKKNQQLAEEKAEKGSLLCKKMLADFYAHDAIDKNHNGSYGKAKKWLEESLYYTDSRYNLARIYIKNKSLSKEGIRLALSACHADNRIACSFIINFFSKIENENHCSQQACIQKIIALQKKIKLIEKLIKETNGYFDSDDEKLQDTKLELANTFITRHDKRGVALLEEAVENDTSFSSSDLAPIYAKGEIVPQNLVRAYMLYDLSGSSYGPEKEEIAKDMTPEQIQQALEMSWRWQEAHHSYRANYRNSGMGIQWQVHQH